MKNTQEILLVDDNKIDCFINQKIISLINQEANVKVFNHSPDALEFIEQLVTQKLDASVDRIILLDINMPVLNGFELADKIHELDGFNALNAKIYFVSSSDNKEDIRKAHAVEGCEGYLYKPLTKEKISGVFA